MIYFRNTLTHCRISLKKNPILACSDPLQVWVKWHEGKITKKQNRDKILFGMRETFLSRRGDKVHIVGLSVVSHKRKLQ